MKLVFIGDVVGSPGRAVLKEYLKKIKQKYAADAVIVNGENAAGGKGMTKKVYHELLEAGADMLTMGNHTWDKKELFDFIDEADRLVRPANFPEGVPGTGIRYMKAGRKKLAVINLQGRTFLPAIDCPFQKADRLIEEASEQTSHIFVDFHAEATSEKLAMGWYLDGRVSAVTGTHTHVPTADERVLPGGTAYITDAGMTGPYNGILGMDKNIVIERFLTSLPARFEVENGDVQLNGFAVTINAEGTAESIKRIRITPDDPFFD
ncbi:TIGR00282 family metallophosphoesterase [Alkalicoccus urumqiensis]|uniref:TIGR00282 family metallophosphoesterase n=1 Tax=Alkalicoccus urumqiensis TaxID=1548213 RepID=A0A2P6MFX0_ALKUR|nr:TIGR00282 family metallophosphoesterase [Alkalicoccus urumqiensis]PRO65167.1 TIGR00282 family metallophosphoesterase [Alkalicoccus urumqiensis]